MRPGARYVCSLAATLLLAGAAVAQTPTWRVDFVGSAPPAWGGAAADAVNDDGLVIGNTTVDLIRRPWFGFPGGGLELLPLPPGTTYAMAEDLNAQGVIVGSVTLEDVGGRAVVWQPGPSGYEFLLLPSGADGIFPFDARAINDRGDVVGKYGLFSNYHWSAETGVTEIAAFPVNPEDINNQRQILGDTYRMDLDTGIVEDLGDPTDTGYNYLFTDLTVINDAGESGGYANVATGQSESKQPVRFTDGVGWKVFNSFPMVTANVMGIAASGDTTYQLGIYGLWVFVEGYGDILLQSTVDPAFAEWDFSDAFAPRISRNGRLATNGANLLTGEGGIVVLTPFGFESLGGETPGALGTPVLSGYGQPAPGEPFRVRLASAAISSNALLVMSTNSNPIPILGGTLYPALDMLILPLQTDALGRAEITFSWPASLPSGTDVFIQAIVTDPEANAPYSRTLSNALVAMIK